MLSVCGADHNTGLLDSAGTEPLPEDLHHQADREMKRSYCRVRGRYYCTAVGLNLGLSTGQILRTDLPLPPRSASTSISSLYTPPV